MIPNPFNKDVQDEYFLLDQLLNEAKNMTISIPKIWEFLKGKKTYLVMGVGIVVNGMYVMGYIHPESLPAVNSILGFLGLGALRSSIN